MHKLSQLNNAEEIEHSFPAVFVREPKRVLSALGWALRSLGVFPSGTSLARLGRHNRLFGYGAVDRFVAELQHLGFEAGSIQIPAPHVHHYHAALDSEAASVLKELDWSHSLLRPEDDQ